MQDNFELLKQKEDEAVNNLISLVNRLRKFEEPAKKIMLRKYPPDRVLDAEGKRAIITITGLRYHDMVYSYQITSLSIKQVEPMEGFDTWVEIPIDVATSIMKKVLSGQNGALDEALGDNRVKIRGKKVYHDMSAFEDVLATLTDNIRKLRSTA